MRKINLGIRKKDVISRGRDDEYNYITNQHYIVRYGRHLAPKDIFTAGTVKKLKDIEVKEGVSWLKLFKETGENEVTDPAAKRSIKDTGFYKDMHGIMAKVYSTPAGMHYINKRYTDFVKNIEDYGISYQHNTLRPITYHHLKEDVSILIAPIRPSEGFERFEVIDRYA